MPKFQFAGLCLLIGIATFCVQQGCAMTGSPASWIAGLIWFLVADILIVMAVWLWDHVASSHWVIKLLLSVLVTGALTILSYGPIASQYKKEHAPAVKPVADALNDLRVEIKSSEPSRIIARPLVGIDGFGIGLPFKKELIWDVTGNTGVTNFSIYGRLYVVPYPKHPSNLYAWPDLNESIRKRFLRDLKAQGGYDLKGVDLAGGDHKRIVCSSDHDASPSEMNDIMDHTRVIYIYARAWHEDPAIPTDQCGWLEISPTQSTGQVSMTWHGCMFRKAASLEVVPK